MQKELDKGYTLVLVLFFLMFYLSFMQWIIADLSDLLTLVET